jgi:hypothetical protein
MGKGSRSAVKHQLFKDKAKNRIDDLHEMFSDLQSARKESRTADVAVLEEQLHQMLREWKAELNQPSPACSLQVIQLVSSLFFSFTLFCRLRVFRIICNYLRCSLILNRAIDLIVY